MIILNTKDALTSFKRLAKVAEKRSTVPVLEQALVTAKDGTASLTADNLDMRLTISLPCQGEISACFDVHKAVKLLQTIKTPTVTFDRDGKIGDFNVESCPADNFPEWKRENKADAFALAPDEVTAIITDLMPFMGADPIRYYMQGVFLEFDECSITGTAVDGHRLATRTINHGNATGANVILPAQFADLLKFLKLKQSSNWQVSANVIDVRVDNMHLQTKTIDGSFPDYRRVIPRRSECKVFATLDKAELLVLCEIAKAYHGRRGAYIGFTFWGDGAAARVSHEGRVHERHLMAETTLDAAFGGEFQTGLNASYLESILRLVPSNAVTFRTRGWDNPLLFQHDGSPTMVLMPMRGECPSRRKSTEPEQAAA